MDAQTALAAYDEATQRVVDAKNAQSHTYNVYVRAMNFGSADDMTAAYRAFCEADDRLGKAQAIAAAACQTYQRVALHGAQG